MDAFNGKLAVVTGGGSGMGRELVRQLAAAGCSVATCDLNPETVAATIELAREGARDGVRLTAHVCDITDAASVEAFRDEVVREHATSSINLLFNNAGIFGAGSFLTDDRGAWERVFAVCWDGVYLMCRAFVPLLVAGTGGYLVNTSTINAFWSVHGPGSPSTAYSSAKAAVRAFTEALIEDFRTHAPHVRAVLVMPGGIRTSIGENSIRMLGVPVVAGAYVDERSAEEKLLDEETGAVMEELGFGQSAEAAAARMLEAVASGRWRVLLGNDAKRLDRIVRADPEHAYDWDRISPTPSWFRSFVQLRRLHRDRGDGDFSGAFELRLDHDTIGLVVNEGRAELSLEAPSSPDAVVVTDAETFAELAAGSRRPADVVERLRIEGDAVAVDRLFGVA